MDTAMQPTANEPHYWIAPTVLVDPLNEAHDNKFLGPGALGHVREDLHRFRQRCEPYKAAAAAVAADDQPLAGRRGDPCASSWLVAV